MTSLSDMQRLHNQSETNTSRSISGSIDRTRPSHQLDFQQAMRDFKYVFSVKYICRNNIKAFTTLLFYY